MTTTPPDVLVIGGGVLGLSTALEMQRRGMAVTVIERDPDGQSASKGNAGAFAFSDIEPLAAPGIMRRAPKWLFDPLGPLSIPSAYALQIAPWLLRFWRASWRDRHSAAIRAQAALMEYSRAALEQLVAETGAEPILRREGQLQLYNNADSFHASLPGWQFRSTHGIAFQLIENAPAQIAEIQPGLDRQFRFAAYTPDWFNVTDPAQWHAHLLDCLKTRGGQFVKAQARMLRPAPDHVAVDTDGVSLQAGYVVLAAGAWSHHLARSMGERLPLETERGYNTTLPDPRFDQKTHLSFTDHGFVVTKVGHCIRVGGAVELGGLNLPPDYRRAEALMNKAQTFLRGLNIEGGTQWMGFRPSMPDSLPVIGKSVRSSRVIHAFGHGHLGLTQSAGTAKLVADLATNVAPRISLIPFRPDRFGFARSV